MNGWTGLQYTIWRVWLAVTIFFWCAKFMESVAAFREAAVASGIIDLGLLAIPYLMTWLAFPAVLMLAAGFRDRQAAIYLAVTMIAQGIATVTFASVLVVGLVLLHAMTPRMPFGSWDARGNDADWFNWLMPERVLRLAWLLLAVVAGIAAYRFYLVAGLHAMRELGLLVALVVAGVVGALGPKIRKFVFPAILLIFYLAPAGTTMTHYSLAMFALLVLLFDPGWIRPKDFGQAIVFYDGACGMCHRATRFLLAEEAERRLRFSALQGSTLTKRLDYSRRSDLPDSMVFLSERDVLYTRSMAVIACWEACGGYWRLGGLFLKLIPGELLDTVYKEIAANRARMFKKPAEACPVLPHGMRARFLP